MKNNKKLLIISAILVLIIIIIAAFVFVKKSASQSGGANRDLASFDAADSAPAAHAYTVAKVPSLVKDDKMFGQAGAPLKIFAYEDYASIYSANLADTLEKIRAEAGDRIALIVRPYFKNSPDAQAAAVAVDCAGRQGKWQEMRALLFARAKQQQAGNMDWQAYARQLGLRENDFQSCLTNEVKSGTIEQAIQGAAAYGVQGAPTLFVGGDMIIGARPYDDFTDSNGDKIAGLKKVVAAKLQ
jgi:protein-disulfide isomerase